MSVGPRLFPIGCDLDDGSLNLVQSLAIVTYAGDPLVCTRLQVWNPLRQLVLDEPVTELIEGLAPNLVSGRHRFILGSGATAYVQVEGGCGCGSTLKSWSPDFPATSGPRP